MKFRHEMEMNAMTDVIVKLRERVDWLLLKGQFAIGIFHGVQKVAKFLCNIEVRIYIYIYIYIKVTTVYFKIQINKSHAGSHLRGPRARSSSVHALHP